MLSDLPFNPNEGIMKIIADVDDYSYFVNRAKEELSKIHLVHDKESIIIISMRLLMLARVKLNAPP